MSFVSLADVIKFVFTHINEQDWNEEYYFVVDMSYASVYKLIACKPMLKDIDSWMEWLNSSRDFYTFLKKMRKGFTLHAAATNRSK